MAGLRLVKPAATDNLRATTTLELMKNIIINSASNSFAEPYCIHSVLAIYSMSRLSLYAAGLIGFNCRRLKVPHKG